MSEIQKETDEIRSTAGYINMPAGTLYYKTYGKKCDTQGKNRLPVVLLHGNRGTHRDFLYRAYGGRASDACDDSYIKMLTGAGCLVIAMDSRGHGRSVLKAAALKTAALKITVGKKGKQQNSSDKRHTAAADMAEDVVRLLDHLKIEKAVILESIKPDGRIGKWCKKEQFLSGLILHSPYLTEERLKRITVPVLLMAGTHDLIKESHTRFIAKCIPDSQLVLIKGGTHQGFFKKKELYTGAISEFLFDKKEVRQD